MSAIPQSIAWWCYVPNKLRETGHTGYVTHEFVPKGDPIAALGTAFNESAKYLSKVEVID